jgi:hypothetical protein
MDQLQMLRLHVHNERMPAAVLSGQPLTVGRHVCHTGNEEEEHDRAVLPNAASYLPNSSAQHRQSCYLP